MDLRVFVDLLPESDNYFLDLHTSASIGCEERVRDILENSENRQVVNAQNKTDWTPLMYASCCANLQVVLLLLEEGANINLKNNLGHTALILASKCGSTDVVNLLIDNGAKINEKDLKGWTALFHATAFNHRSVVQLLLEKGALMDIVDGKNKMTPLMLSAAAGHELIVKDLLQYGSNPGIESKTVETAMSLAIKNGHLGVKNMIEASLHYKKNSILPNIRNSDLHSLLKDLQLSKYYHFFEKHEIDLSTFLMLTDENLQEIGIKLVGPRKKMRLAIAQWHQNHSADGNPDNKTYTNKLRAEIQQLQQQILELKFQLSHEKDLRTAADHKLQEGIQTFKNFTDAVQHTVASTIQLQDKLKEKHNNLIKLLCSTSQFLNIGQWTKLNMDVIFQLLEHMGKLIDDIHNQSMLCLTQTSFKS